MAYALISVFFDNTLANFFKNILVKSKYLDGTIIFLASNDVI